LSQADALSEVENALKNNILSPVKEKETVLEPVLV